ncbi:MAG: glycosyltransferase [Chitinophagales bacterium]|nr:glycosyltransferase [Chitinophagales bacterium]MDW8418246.1 glycosyltransferase [Chitinophagales bacterium]
MEKKVLIIAYYFPPCNLPAAQRAWGWALYLKNFGWHPVILTRRWDKPINALADAYTSTPPEVQHEVNDTHEVIRVPYQANLRDKLLMKYGETRYASPRKALTLLELLLQNFYPRILPYHRLFTQALQYARAHRPHACVVTGNPFVTFKAAYDIHRALGVPWIADYRDAWTTSEINFIHRSGLYRALNYFEKYFEKKWVRTAGRVTASSLPIAQGIEKLTGTPATALYNGFIASDFDGIPNQKYDVFTVTYVGTLYYGQKIEIFCEAFKKLIDETPGIRARLFLPGMMYFAEQHERIKRIMQGYEQYVECTPRMERKTILEIEKKSHLLLHVAWDEQRGIIASKIYEYLASGTPVLVTPTDRGSIEEIIRQSGCGDYTSGVEDTLALLRREYHRFASGEVRYNDVNSPRVQQFSRHEQVKKLAELLNSLPAL